MKLEYLKKTPRLFFKNGALPLYFIHFVTTKCNLQCSHCFYHNSLCSNDSELTIDEIKRITKSIGEILLIILTGGEPFLRSDLPEIARLYYENAHAREIAIITNGTLLNKISEIAPEIAKNCPQAKIMITLSYRWCWKGSR